LSNLKAITGGDRLSFHELYKGSRNTIFKTKIVISTNNVPDFNDSSGALVNRALVFPFYKSFAGMENNQLREVLLKEVSGITQWAIKGLQRLRTNHGVFTESKSGKREKEEMRKDMFPLAQYVERALTIDKKAFTFLEDLYSAYRLWAASEGFKSPMIKTHFNKHLRNSALPIIYENTNTPGYHGITIKSMLTSNNVVAMRP
jgi:putative DNA primase/helicase